LEYEEWSNGVMKNGVMDYWSTVKLKEWSSGVVE
jgi:hypothetical protein